MMDRADLVAQIVADITRAAPFDGYGTVPPRSVADAFSIQNAVTEMLSETPGFGPVIGWKIAANAPALLDRLGLQEPLSGRVFSGQCHDSPARLRAADYREFAFEPEIAAVLGADLPLQDAPFDPARVTQAIERFVPAVELLDMRNADMATVHIPDAVAQNVSNVGAVLGGPGVRPDALNSALVRTVLTIDDAVVHDVMGGASQDPVEAVTWLANHLAARGLALTAGNFVLCGTHSPIWYHVGAGEILIEMSGLGEVSLILS